MPESYVLKIRQGCAGGGKGPLLGKEVSFTLATSQDQTLFQAVPNSECLTPWDVQSRRIYPDSAAWPAIYAGDGGGHGYVMKEIGEYEGESDMQPIPMKSDTTPKAGEPGDPAFTLRRGGEGGIHDEVAIMGDDGYIVRRLTPKECERLQGFPDDWTRIPYDKTSKIKAKPTDEGAFIDRYDEDTGEPIWRKLKVTHVSIEKCPDGPRYKALGNSMAVPVIKWLGQRVEMVNEIVKEIEDERKSGSGAIASSADDKQTTLEIR